MDMADREVDIEGGYELVRERAPKVIEPVSRTEPAPDAVEAVD